MTYLAPFEISMFHITATSSYVKPGWGLVSVYGPRFENEPSTKWDEHKIYMVELTTRTTPPPKVWVVAHSRSFYYDYGFTNPFAGINREGRRIYFCSTWEKNWGDPTAQADVYMITLPPNWYQDLATGFAVVAGAPNLLSATIDPDGTIWEFSFDKSVSVGAGGSGGWAATTSTAGVITLTLVSGSGSSTLLYSGNKTVLNGESITSGLNYTQPTNGIEDLSGTDLANISSFSVTNTSTQTIPDGNTLIGYKPTTPSSTLDTGNLIIGTPFVAPSDGAANPGLLHVYASRLTGTGHMRCGVYSDNGGSFQGSTLITSASEMNISATGWISTPITWSNIHSGTTYWFVCSTDDLAFFHYDPLTTPCSVGNGAGNTLVDCPGTPSKFNGYYYTGTLPSTGPTVYDLPTYTYAIYISYNSGETEPRGGDPFRIMAPIITPHR
jgi:hypothetical protein